MSRRILMATVATFALAAPAMAQDPAEAPIDTEMKAIQLAENAQPPAQESTGAPITPPAAHGA